MRCTHGTGSFPPSAPHRFSLTYRRSPLSRLSSRLELEPHRRPSAARGRHPRALLGPGPAPAPRVVLRTPECSRGHAAVTQPGTVKTLLPGSGRSDTSPATGSELERRPPCSRDRTPPRLPPMTERSPGRAGPAGGPFRRDPKSLIDRVGTEREKQPPTGLLVPGATATAQGLRAPASGDTSPEAADAGGPHTCEKPSGSVTQQRKRARGVPPPTRGPHKTTEKKGSCHRPCHGPPAFARLAAIGFPPGKAGGRQTTAPPPKNEKQKAHDASHDPC